MSRCTLYPFSRYTIGLVLIEIFYFYTVDSCALLTHTVTVTEQYQDAHLQHPTHSCQDSDLKWHH